MLSLKQIGLISKRFKCPLNEIYIDVDRADSINVYRKTPIKNSASPLPELERILWVYLQDSDIVVYHGQNGPEYYNTSDILKEPRNDGMELAWNKKFSFPETE